MLVIIGVLPSLENAHNVESCLLLHTNVKCIPKTGEEDTCHLNVIEY